MTPDDRAADLSPADREAHRLLDETFAEVDRTVTGLRAAAKSAPDTSWIKTTDGERSPLLPLARGPEALRDAITIRVVELVTFHPEATELDDAVRQALEEFHVGERQAPPVVGYLVLAVIALVALVALIPALGYLIGALIPFWTDAFSWLP